MEKAYKSAGLCLWFLFWAEILGLIGMVVQVIPLVGKLLYIVLLLVACVFQFYGPYSARDAHPHFKNAFFASIMVLVLAFFSTFFQEGFMHGLVQILIWLMNFCVVYFICTASRELLAQKGDKALADRAVLIIKLDAVCVAVGIVINFLVSAFGLNNIVIVATVVTVLAQIVSHILLIVFYHQASNSLQAA